MDDDIAEALWSRKASVRIASVIFMFHPFYGGAEVQAHLLARKYQDFGHEVTVLTMHFGTTARHEVFKDVQVVRVPPRPVAKGHWAGIIRAMTSAFFELRRLRPDIVHMHGVPFLLIPVLLFKKLYDVPVVVKMISIGVTSKSTILMTERWRLFNWLKRLLLKNVDSFVCLNDELEAEVKSLVPTASCIRIPNGVDCSFWHRPHGSLEHKTALGLKGSKTAIFVGRFVPEKGVDVLLKVWKEVVGWVPTAKLFLVGDGPLLNEMREFAASFGVLEQCEFVGSTSDVRRFLVAMDVFLLFSPNEGMSNALLEAMASGVPIVCSENPGNAVLIRHMVNGIKVQPGQISEAAAGVRRIFEDEAFAASLAERAQADVRSKYDVAVTARQYEDLSRQLVHSHA
jgi:glycosyltransferase involved in cell wall biosynthesis